MYTLRDVDIANLDVDAFDVKLKFFVNKKTRQVTGGSLVGKPISGSDFYSASYGKISNQHVIKSACGVDGLYAASAFTEIEVPFDGSFEETMDGNSITWSAKINNSSSAAYQPTIGDQVVCYRKTSSPSSYSDIVLYSKLNSSSAYTDINNIATYPSGSAVAYSPCSLFNTALFVAPCSTNYILNPSLETNAASFAAAANCTVERSANIAFSGNYSARVTTTNTSWFVLMGQPNLENSTTYTVSAYVWQSASNASKPNIYVYEVYNAASNAQYVGSLMTGSGWQRYALTFTSASNTNYANIYIYSGASDTGAGEIYYIDAVQLEKGNVATPYFDGSLGTGYSWSGTAHASISTRKATTLNYGNITGMSASYGSIAMWADIQTISGSQTLWSMGNSLAAYISASKLYYQNSTSSASVAASPGWHHYAFLWNSATSQKALYTDGTARATGYYTPASSGLGLGYNTINGGSITKTAFNKLMIFNRNISGTEVNNIYQNTGAEHVGNDWHLWFNGIVTDIDGMINNKQDSRNFTVSSIRDYLYNFDSPRITVDSLNIAADGATAQVSSTLINPTQEIQNREFIGTLVSCSAENIVDNRLDTVWISEDTPTTTIQAATSNTYPVIDEFFVNPVVGWNSDDTWWFEGFNATGKAINPVADGWAITAYNRKKHESIMLEFATKNPEGSGLPARHLSTQYQVLDQHRFIVCSDIDKFENYTGGARFANDWVIEAKSFDPQWDNVATYGHNANYPPEFTLSPSGGYIAIGIPDWRSWLGGNSIYIYDCVVWGTDMYGRNMADYLPSYLNGKWSGAGVTASAPDGYSYRRIITGNDTNSANDWMTEKYPKPGSKLEDRVFEWAQIELRDMETYVNTSASVGNTTIDFDTLLGWPISGSAVLEGELIRYTNRTNTTLYLTGSVSNPHEDGARAYPLNKSGVAMTGWPLDSITIRRKPGLSRIHSYSVLTSHEGGLNTPDQDAFWEQQYDQTMVILQNGFYKPKDDQYPLEAEYDITRTTLDAQGDPRWVKTIFIAIWQMEDFGRAKINEVVANLSGLAVSKSNFDNIANRNAGYTIRYLLDNYTDTAASAIFSDQLTQNWGKIGNLQLGIANLPEVFDSICDNTSSWIRYGVDGQISLERDPWHPGATTFQIVIDTNGKANISKLAIPTINGTQIRDGFNYSNAVTRVTGVKLNAILQNGAPAREVIVPPGANGTGVIEVSDKTVSSDTDATNIAWGIYKKESSNQKMTLALKGTGSGIFVGQKFKIAINGIEHGLWIIENVNTNWSMANDGVKDWQTTIELHCISEK